MDREPFDVLARLIARKQSRRAALTAFLGATALGRAPMPLLAKGRRKANAQITDRCYPGTTCTPGKGRNTSGCDFATSTLFRNKDVRGANLSQSSFVGADLRGADLRGANLSGSCFVSADLTGARLGSSVNLHGAIFCNTVMPDGRIDDSGCEETTPCCHLQVQDCPDGGVGCYIVNLDAGQCDLVHTFPSVGHCGQGPGHSLPCCPCDHPDETYWTTLCNTTVDACKANPGGCQVKDEAAVAGFHCFDACSPN
jgi:Pentapeptide repeats (8 copies)